MNLDEKRDEERKWRSCPRGEMALETGCRVGGWRRRGPGWDERCQGGSEGPLQGLVKRERWQRGRPRANRKHTNKAETEMETELPFVQIRIL